MLKLEKHTKSASDASLHVASSLVQVHVATDRVSCAERARRRPTPPDAARARPTAAIDCRSRLELCSLLRLLLEPSAQQQHSSP